MYKLKQSAMKIGVVQMMIECDFGNLTGALFPANDFIDILATV